MGRSIPVGGRFRAVRFSVGAVMGAVLASAVLLAVLIPRPSNPRLEGFEWSFRWSHALSFSAYRAEWFAIAGAIAGVVVMGRGLLGGAAPSRAEWLAVALAVFAAVDANERAGDALGRAITRVTGGWAEAAGLILPAFSPATVGMLVVLACLLALRRAEGRGRTNLSAPLVAAMVAAMFWGPLPAAANWARWSVGGWAVRFDLARLLTGLLYATAVVSAIRDFARPRPAGPARRATEWVALASWMLLLLAWACRTASVVLPNPSRASRPLSWSPHPALVWLLDLAGPQLVELGGWLVAAALGLAILRLVERLGPVPRPADAVARA